MLDETGIDILGITESKLHPNEHSDWELIIDGYMFFITFTQFAHQEKYMQLGLFTQYELDCLFTPVHWFQFAGDAAVISAYEQKNQLVLIALPNGVTGKIRL